MLRSATMPMAAEAVAPDRVAVLLGKRMRKIRDARALSQERLAHRAGFSRETVRRVGAGIETTTATLDRLLWAMEADADELLATRVLRSRHHLSTVASSRTTANGPVQLPMAVLAK